MNQFLKESIADQYWHIREGIIERASVAIDDDEVRTDTIDAIFKELDELIKK